MWSRCVITHSPTIYRATSIHSGGLAEKVGVVWEHHQLLGFQTSAWFLPLWCESLAIQLYTHCGYLILPVRMCVCLRVAVALSWTSERWRAARSGALCVSSSYPPLDFASVPVSSTRSLDSHCSMWAQNKASLDPRLQASALSAGKKRAQLYYYPHIWSTNIITSSLSFLEFHINWHIRLPLAGLPDFS